MTTEHGFFFFLAPFFCKVSVLDCCTGQSPGNEMNSLLVQFPGDHATRKGVAKSKPCSLRRGWGSAGGSGLVGGRQPRCCGKRCPRITSFLQGW